MPDFYDDLETRAAEARERGQFAALPDLIARAMSAAGWREQLAGADSTSITSREALAKLPILRKSDLKERQSTRPPLGGFAVTAPGRLKRLLVSPGPIFEPEGHGKDFWNSARALIT